MEPPFPRTALSMTAGVLIWAADFLFIYVFAALACARGFASHSVLGVGIVPFASAVSTAVAVGATLWALRALRRTVSAEAAAERAFRARMTLAVILLGLIAVGMTALPGVMVRGTCL